MSFYVINRIKKDAVILDDLKYYVKMGILNKEPFHAHNNIEKKKREDNHSSFVLKLRPYSKAFS